MTDKPVTDKKEPRPIANLTEVASLAQLMEDHNLLELEVADDDRKVHLVRSAPQPGSQPTAAVQIASAKDDSAEKPPEAAQQTNGHPIKSPMVGTFYRSAAPTAEPYVQLGSQVKAGDCLCLLEAMKMMTPLEADRAGTIKQILANDGDVVEYDQTLFLIEDAL